MKAFSFAKMVGAGNDFVVIDNRAGKITAGAKLAARLCDRKRSIGADGLMLLEQSKKDDFRMRIFNADGSEAEMCGNGVRCLAKFVADRRLTKKPTSAGRFTIETLAGSIGVELKGDIVKARLVNPTELRLSQAVTLGSEKIDFHFLNTGVPHAVVFRPSVELVDVEGIGRQIRHHRHFAPRGTNVNFVALRKGGEIDVRTYERGVEGETLACGTGSTASALVSAALKGLRSPVIARTRSGEKLKIYFTRDGAGFRDVFLEGAVSQAFEGRVNA